MFTAPGPPRRPSRRPASSPGRGRSGVPASGPGGARRSPGSGRRGRRGSRCRRRAPGRAGGPGPGGDAGGPVVVDGDDVVEGAFQRFPVEALAADHERRVPVIGERRARRGVQAAPVRQSVDADRGAQVALPVLVGPAVQRVVGGPAGRDGQPAQGRVVAGVEDGGGEAGVVVVAGDDEDLSGARRDRCPGLRSQCGDLARPDDRRVRDRSGPFPGPYGGWARDTGGGRGVRRGGGGLGGGRPGGVAAGGEQQQRGGTGADVDGVRGCRRAGGRETGMAKLLSGRRGDGAVRAGSPSRRLPPTSVNAASGARESARGPYGCIGRRTRASFTPGAGPCV